MTCCGRAADVYVLLPVKILSCGGFRRSARAVPYCGLVVCCRESRDCPCFDKKTSQTEFTLIYC